MHDRRLKKNPGQGPSTSQEPQLHIKCTFLYSTRMFSDRLLNQLPSSIGDKTYWCSLFGSAQAAAIASLVEQQPGFYIVVTENTQRALSFETALRFYKPDVELLHFPDWETLPYDQFSPHQDIISERIDTLYKLTQAKQGVLTVPINTLLQRISPKAFVDQHHFSLKVGDTLEPEAFKTKLQNGNYQRVNTVYEHGEFAIRGGLIDIFPMGAKSPYRIELFDDEIETIKVFDTETQRSSDKVKRIDMLPAKEFPLDEKGINTFKDNWCDHFDVLLKDTLLYDDIHQGIGFSGVEYYLPLFFDQTASLLDYLPDSTLLITLDGIESTLRQYWQDIDHRYEQYGIDKQRPLLPPGQLFFREEALFRQFKQFKRLILSDKTISDNGKGFIAFDTKPFDELSIDHISPDPYVLLKQFLGSANKPLLFCAETLGRKEALRDLFQSLEINYQDIENIEDFLHEHPAIGLTVAPIDQGLNLDNLAIIAENQLFGSRVQQRRRRKKIEDASDAVIKSLTELKLGSAVVHLDHGIGRYLGLKVIEVEGVKNEFLHLQYANEASLYVPVASLHLISRYTGAESADQVSLHKLGTDTWNKAKKKASEKANDVAAQLLDIYARRAARKGFAHSTYTEDYRRFCDEFPFEETDDQLMAISRVLEDMAKDTPMDRLVCGDVGFGKTEVAMRAAFTAVHSQKQVAVLVPTTLLAQQHYESFVDRFAKHAISIEVLSRFKTAKDQQAVIDKLSQGKIDILIGTHKILQGDIQFDRLGLVIIDEEHRFGVKQKEVLKNLRSEVDVLAMTATPIPRTLNLSMAGIRDISIIATPPAKRLSIKTFVHQREDRIIKEAVLRELLRGGQVYFLYNEVKTIEQRARELAELIPEARIGIGHGQMRERELESVMSDFYHKRFNLLLCTTIIETGIDVPSANTIIIERADKFGLAQLHQLRGRVGRSHHQAYAYLLTPKDKKLTKDAEKRLEAITEAQDLGAGFMLATHDLEIRGAGELLGDGQSGHIQTVGYTLYMDMLDKAVKSIQRGETPNINAPLNQGTEVDLGLSAIIPEDYLPDIHLRLIMYKKIANCQNTDDIKALKIEMIDRFGLLPDPLDNLFAVTGIKLEAEKLGITKVVAGAQQGRMDFAQDTPIDPMKLVSLIQKAPKVYALDGPARLKFSHKFEDSQARVKGVHAILASLQ